MNQKIAFLSLLLLSVSCGASAVTLGKEGIPVLWDTAWILPLADQTTIDNYLTTRADQGFDGVLTGVSKWGLENVVLGNGQKLFLADKGVFEGRNIGDITKPNDAGFAYVDRTIHKAQSLGLVVGLLPMNNGGSGDYVYSLTDIAGENRAYSYGFYMGNRYKRYSNIIWMLGGDLVGPLSWPSVAALSSAFKDGLRVAGATQPISFHPGGEDLNAGYSSSWLPPDGQWLTFNMMQWKSADVSGAVRTNRSLGKPTGLGEGGYEGQTGWTDARLRAQAYQTYLAGGAYATYGEILFRGGSVVGGVCCGTYSNVSTAAASQAVRAKNLMLQRGWQSYSPDESFISNFNGLKTASIKGNSAAMIYLATAASTVSVTMSRINALGNVEVKRFNPAGGSTVLIGTYASSGVQTFTTGGLADAVVLLDAVSSGYIPSTSRPVQTALVRRR